MQRPARSADQPEHAEAEGGAVGHVGLTCEEGRRCGQGQGGGAHLREEPCFSRVLFCLLEVSNDFVRQTWPLAWRSVSSTRNGPPEPPQTTHTEGELSDTGASVASSTASKLARQVRGPGFDRSANGSSAGMNRYRHQ